MATGAHGLSRGGVGSPVRRFLRDDARSIMETMQRHPGLKIIAYNMADPAQAAKFYALQALAADQKLPGGAAFAALCFSRTCVPEVNESPAGPYGTVEVLEGRGASGTAYMCAGLSAGVGALSVYGGLQDPNRVVGALKVGGGAAINVSVFFGFLHVTYVKNRLWDGTLARKSRAVSLTFQLQTIAIAAALGLFLAGTRAATRRSATSDRTHTVRVQSDAECHQRLASVQVIGARQRASCG